METTGRSPKDDRICEIGCIELCDLVPTGRTFHAYIDPKKTMPREAENVHGLSDAFLRGKPVFRQIAPAFLMFIGNRPLVAHNGEAFDIKFLNAELERIGRPKLENELIDTLVMARRQRPGQKNGLDALAKEYGVDASKRTKHGALIDSEILAGVYLNLRGGAQRELAVQVAQPTRTQATQLQAQPVSIKRKRRITREEFERHKAFVRSMGEGAIWLQHEIYARHLRSEEE